MSNFTDISDTAVASASVKWGMGGGAVTSIFGCLSQNELLILAGIITTLGGFIVNLIFQWRRDRRSKEEHELTKQLLEAQIQNAKQTSS